MVNNSKYYFNITRFFGHALLRSNYGKYDIPSFKVLGRNPKIIAQSILEIEEILPPGEFNFCSEKNEGISDEIYPKKELEELCNMLNEGKEEAIFKLAS